MYFKEDEKLLSTPIARAAYSGRTAWLMAEMSRFAYTKFEKNDTEYEKLKNEIKGASFDLIDTFNTSNSDTLSGTQAFLATRETDKIAILAFRGTEMEEFTFEFLKDI